MADLINRDELIKTLWAHCNAVAEDKHSPIQQIYRMAYEHAIEVIKIYPTAYDMDKVVAELEEEKYTREEKFQYDTRMQEKMCSYNQGLNKAIAIVKAGGINE